MKAIASAMIPSLEQQQQNQKGHSQVRTRRQRALAPKLDHRREIESKINVMRRVFPTMLRALHSLGIEDKDDLMDAQILYQFIGFFRTLLDQIMSAAVRDHNRPPTLSKRARRAIIGPSSLSEAINTLCQLLVSLLSALDNSYYSDREISDCARCLLLTRVGSTLEHFTLASIELSPGNGHRTSAGTGSIDENTEDDSAVAGAPYLLYLLHHILGDEFLYSQDDAARFTQTWKENTPPEKCGCHTPLSKARRRLQATMLSAVFPKEQFEGVLPSPPAPDPLWQNLQSRIKRPKDQNVRSWFLSDVWKIVGWEILTDKLLWGPDNHEEARREALTYNFQDQDQEELFQSQSLGQGMQTQT